MSQSWKHHSVRASHHEGRVRRRWRNAALSACPRLNLRPSLVCSATHTATGATPRKTSRRRRRRRVSCGPRVPSSSSRNGTSTASRAGSDPPSSSSSTARWTRHHPTSRSFPRRSWTPFRTASPPIAIRRAPAPAPVDRWLQTPRRVSWLRSPLFWKRPAASPAPWYDPPNVRVSFAPRSRRASRRSTPCRAARAPPTPPPSTRRSRSNFDEARALETRRTTHSTRTSPTPRRRRRWRRRRVSRATRTVGEAFAPWPARVEDVPSRLSPPHSRRSGRRRASPRRSRPTRGARAWTPGASRPPPSRVSSRRLVRSPSPRSIADRFPLQARRTSTPRAQAASPSSPSSPGPRGTSSAVRRRRTPRRGG
mmetsp:Transcript_4099/g.18399  ORF Transcript_4099/g.18399 Transcript_4099/m.18399 type:complete len:366 (-) Transcript_4099:1933-3030(-)